MNPDARCDIDWEQHPGQQKVTSVSRGAAITIRVHFPGAIRLIASEYIGDKWLPKDPHIGGGAKTGRYSPTYIITPKQKRSVLLKGSPPRFPSSVDPQRLIFRDSRSCGQ